MESELLRESAVRTQAQDLRGLTCVAVRAMQAKDSASAGSNDTVVLNQIRLL